MTVSELIHTDQTRTDFSFEVLPPLKGNGTAALFRTIDTLKEFGPKYINITTHRSEYVYTERPDGSFDRQRIRRRPGTVAVASAIRQKYDIKVVPHVVCSGATQEDIEYMLLDLQFLGLHDVLLLRGDKAPDEKVFTPVPGGYSHTTELIEQVNKFNAGHFADGSPIRQPGVPFSYGVACYPEKHEEAPNLEFDLQILLRKQQMGASYAITQLFFDNRKYFSFVERARALGITIPIIPGIKPLAKLSQFSVVPKTFHVDLPEALSREAEKCRTDAEMQQLGVEWGIAQCRELIAAGVPSIHFYTVSAVESIRQIAEAIY
jgi:methylenetetrahydrofolate reductase (NADPH)